MNSLRENFGRIARAWCLVAGALSALDGMRLHAASQTLSWASPAEDVPLVWGRAYPLMVRTSSGLPVTFRVANGPAFIAAGSVTVTNAGTIVLVAEQAGDAQFAPVSESWTYNQPPSPNVAVYDTAWSACGVQVVGNLAFVADVDAGLEVIDVSDPAAPVRVGGYNTIGQAWDVHVAGNLAGVADGYYGLQLIDVSNPAAPRRLGGCDTSGTAEAVRIVGDLAYVADGESGLQVIDVSNPAAPRRIGGYDTVGRAKAVRVVGNVAYVADYTAGLQLIDVGNPAAPRRLGGFDTVGTAEDLDVAGDLAYIADGYFGLQVIDVSNPAAPKRLGGYDTDGWSSGVQVVGNLAYVADYGGGLQVIDVSDPAAPMRVNGLYYGVQAQSVQVVDHLAYVADGNAGLRVLHVSSKLNQALNFSVPVQIHRTNVSVALGGAASSGLPVSYTVVSGPATISGDRFAPVGVGPVTIRAEQAGNAQFLPALPVTRTITVIADSQTLAFSLPSVLHRTNSPLTLEAVSSSGLPVSYTVESGPATVNGDRLTLIGPGVVTIRAEQEGNVQFLPALPVTRTITVIADSQTLTFSLPPVLHRTNSPLTLEAAASSGLPVSYTVVSGPATVSGDRLTLTGTGAVTVRAEQGGNDQFLPATPVERSVTVFADPQSITWASPAADTPLVWGKAHSLAAAASSGLPVTFRVESGPAFIADGTVTVTNAGIVRLVTEQAGDDRFAPASLGRVFNRPKGAVITRLGGYDTSGQAVAVQVVGGLAYVADGAAGLQVIDVSSPSAPAHLGSYDTSGAAYGVQLVGNVAYVADYGLGLQAIDVSNPAAPVRVGGYDTGGLASGVQVIGDLAYVADGDAGLQVIDVSDPAASVKMGAYNTPGWAQDVRVVGKLAYVADGAAGLQMFDVSNPAAPARVGGHDTSGTATGVQVVGGLAFAADLDAGLQVIDVSNPAAPVRLGGYDTSGWALGVQVVGNLAYVADSEGGLQLLDVSDPANPVRLGGYDTGGTAFGVQVVGDLAYVADGAAGLQVLQVTTKLGQTLDFTLPESVHRTNLVLTLGAAASSGLPVSYTVVSGPATVSGDQLRFAGTGPVQVRAEQAGNDQFLAATTQERTLTVFADPQSFAWTSPVAGVPLVWGQAYPLAATASSGLPVTFRVESGPAFIADGTVTVTNVGLVTLVAAQAGDVQFAAVSLIRTFNRPPPLQRLGALDTSGNARAVNLVGNLAYVADGGAGLQVVDVSNPAAPKRLGGYDTSGSANGLQVVGHLVYVADDTGGLQVIDVSNPAVPVRLGGYDTAGLAMAVQVVGNLAYVADFTSGLQVIDVSNPASPVRLGGHDTTGQAWAVHVVGSLAYVADGDAGLQVISVANPAVPKRLGGYNTSGIADGVRVAGNLAHVADGPSGLQVIDVSNPAAPRRVGGYDTGGNANGLQLVGNTAYLADGSAGIQVIDASNPAAPVRLGGFDTTGQTWAVHVVGNLAYVADGGAGLQVIKVPLGLEQSLSWTSPAAGAPLVWGRAYPLTATVSSGLPVTFRVANGPAFIAEGAVIATNAGTITLVAEQTGDAQFAAVSVSRRLNEPAFTGTGVAGLGAGGWTHGVAVAGTLAVVADEMAGLQVLDLTDPRQPVRRGGLSTVGKAAGAVELKGTTCLVADGPEGLQVIDVANPSGPVRVGVYDTPGSARGVRLVGDRAFVADGLAGLLILDLRDPASPVRLGSIDTPGWAESVDVEGDFAFVADGATGLQVIEVSNPAAPLRVGGYDTSGNANGVQVVGHLAYVADDTAGLQLIDVSNPAAPVRLGGYDTSGAAAAVQVRGGIAYVADWEAGLQVIDVGDPAAPVRLGAYDTAGVAIRLRVAGEFAYLADGAGGLQVLELSFRIPPTLFFTLPSTLLRTSSPVALSARTSSGLPVSFTVVSGPATVTENLLTLTGSGRVLVRAEQAGNAQFLPAGAEVSVNVVEPEEPPVIELPPPGADGKLTLEVTAGAGQEVIVETTPDLNTWTEAQRVTGQGSGTPVRVTITPQAGVEARFWRVRRP